MILPYLLRFVTLCNLLLFSLYGEEVRVELQATHALNPIYIGSARIANSTLSSPYISQLQEIFERDLNWNGSTRVVQRTPEREQLTYQPNISTCKAMGIPYVAVMKFDQQEVTLKLFNARSGKMHIFSPIRLSGMLDSDRRLIHRLADNVHKTLFDIHGIASTKILFSWQKQEGIPGSPAEIWECDWDGENLRQITHENSTCITPVAVPSSHSFLFVSYKQGKPKIYIGSRTNPSTKPFVPLRGNQLLPAISMQRDKIAFISDVSSRADLFLLSLNSEEGEMGKPQQLFSFPRAVQASPTFHPDGSKIAFVSDKDGSPRIYIISLNDSPARPSATLISKKNRESTCPAWSPDGKKIAYSAKTEGVRQIWIYDFEKKEERQLTSGPGNKENPSWAPNSQHLVFNISDRDHADLYVAHMDHPKVLKITHQPGKKHYPSWGE